MLCVSQCMWCGVCLSVYSVWCGVHVSGCVVCGVVCVCAYVCALVEAREQLTGIYSLLQCGSWGLT